MFCIEYKIFLFGIRSLKTNVRHHLWDSPANKTLEAISNNICGNDTWKYTFGRIGSYLLKRGNTFWPFQEILRYVYGIWFLLPSKNEFIRTQPERMGIFTFWSWGRVPACFWLTEKSWYQRHQERTCPCMTIFGY